jgi:hypothetical protein
VLRNFLFFYKGFFPVVVAGWWVLTKSALCNNRDFGGWSSIPRWIYFICIQNIDRDPEIITLNALIAGFYYKATSSTMYDIIYGWHLASLYSAWAPKRLQVCGMPDLASFEIRINQKWNHNLRIINTSVLIFLLQSKQFGPDGTVRTGRNPM